MASTLPLPSQCCAPTCDETTTVNIPGAPGAPGAGGAAGTNGVSAFTTVTVNFTMPGELATVNATVASTAWMAVGMVLWVTRVDATVKGYMQVTAIGSGTSVTLKNLKDTPSSAYLGNSAAGTVNVGSQVTTGGLQGPGSGATGAAGGDLKGTYPNPKILVANTKGSILAGNGTDTTAVAVGADGQMISADATAGNGVKWSKTQPKTADTDVADNRITRLDGTTGLPIPVQSSKITITDNGALQADGSGGNARGTDAIDLQVTRSGATQVASGTNSTLAGGSGNTASGAQSTVAGGISNVASAQYGAVGGGNTNTANTRGSAVAGGESNTAGNAGANNRAFVGGGQSNAASGQESTIAGGQSNIASGTQSTVGGGDSNQATGQESTVAGGVTSIASGSQSSIGGGIDNRASATAATVPGGNGGKADKYGQLAHASGYFAGPGDAQTSELTWRGATANATPTEIFLDGAGQRASIAASSTWAFHIHIIGRSSAGVSAAWEVKGAIQNNAGTTALVAAVTNALLGDGTGGTWGALGNVPAVTADNVNDALIITVIGFAATNIRWSAHARLVEVQF